MKNPNSPMNKIKASLAARWSGEDYPGAEPRFQITLLGRDLAIFVLLPVLTVILFKACEDATTSDNKPKRVHTQSRREASESSHSQIINFAPPVVTGKYSGLLKKSPGTLVKVKLLNVVETYSNAPVHVQILDASLGRTLMGGTLIGDAVADTNFERINITFRFARNPRNASIAVPMSARALSLDGTLGLIATKKEGFITRSAIGSTNAATQNSQNNENPTNFKDVLFKALTAGLAQEFGSAAKVEKNRAEVLTLRPPTEFFVELTDFFPGGSQ
jgi:hypothetical protein